MSDFDWAYRVIVGFLALMAVVAVAAGGVGLYTVLTGGTGDGTPETDVLGEYACEEFDADPAVGHNSSYGVDRTLLGGSAIASVNASVTDGGLRMRIDVNGGILSASASRPDGAAVPVEQVEGADRLVIETPDPGPFRLWIDSVSDEAVVTRTQLDVCPPG
jgi:hypothetical protein